MIENIKRSDVVFFDFFDTIVHRRINEKQLAIMWANEVSLKCCYSFSAETLLLCRQKAFQKIVGSDSTEEVDYKTLAHTIYCMLHLYIENITEDDFYELAYDTEKDLECKYQYIDSDIENWFDMVKAEKKEIGIISDFYMGTEAIKLFLKNVGLSPDMFCHIYVSSEYGKKKATGNLYKIIVDEMGPSKNLLMIGDNKHSDFIQAKSNGFSAIYKDYHNSIDFKKVNTEKEIKNVYRRYKNTAFATYAFSLYYFIRNIYEEAVKCGYKTIGFLAREGYLLKDLFEEYQKDKSIKIEVKYIYASRLSTLLPSLNDLDTEDFSAVLNQYGDISPASFLRNLCFAEDEINNLIGDLEMDPHKIIRSFGTSKEFCKLKAYKNFRCMYENRRVKSKAEFMNYFINAYPENEPVVLIDIGWKGTIQDNIYKVLGGERIVTGLYYGIFNQTGNENVYNRKKAFLFNRFPNYTKYYSYWEFETHLMEQLLFAPHGSTTGYCNCEPLLENNPEDDKLYKHVKPIQKNIKLCFEDICNIFKDEVKPLKDFFENITRIHLATELKISKEILDFERISLSEKTNNFGWFSQIPLDKKRESRGKKLLREIKHIHDRGDGNNAMKYLSYFTVKLNAREIYRYKPLLFRFVYLIETIRVLFD